MTVHFCLKRTGWGYTDIYKALKTGEKIRPPYYEVPPLDLFSAIAPWTYHDRRETLHVMQKYKPPTDAELHERAQELREQNLLE